MCKCKVNVRGRETDRLRRVGQLTVTKVSAFVSKKRTGGDGGEGSFGQGKGPPQGSRTHATPITNCVN